MLQKVAAAVTSELMHHIDLSDVPGPNDRAFHVTRDALFTSATVFIPDDASGAVATYEGGGILVATDDESLYTIEGIPPEHEMDIGRTRCRLLGLDRLRDSVENVSGFRRPMGEVIRETSWRFSVRDLKFQIETKFDEDDLAWEPAEQFAQRLAVALGWAFGGDARAARRVA